MTGKTPQTPAGPSPVADGGGLAGSSAQYAAARAKALKTQARRRPADPQQTTRHGDPRARVAEMRRLCTCTHPELSHWKTDAGRVTWCSIATSDGPCGCESYQPAPSVLAEPPGRQR